MKNSKYEKGTLSLAHAAFLMEFPGKALELLYWLRQQNFFSDDLKPLPMYIQGGFFVNQSHDIPGRTRGQNEKVNVPRITRKGLLYISGVFNGTISSEPCSETNSLS